MLLVDSEIVEHCTDRALWFGGMPLIDPFVRMCQDGVMSYGVTAAGYDMRLNTAVWVFRNTRSDPVDPKRFKDEQYLNTMFDRYDAAIGGTVVLPGHSYALVQSFERFSLPWWIKGRCVGKSTYARCGVIVNTTPLEPEWYGNLTIELSIANPRPVTLYVGEGIAQVEFERLPKRPEQTYADKKGKYQAQTDVTPPRIKHT